MKQKIAVFASGTGSNAKAIIEYAKSSNYEVALIVSNKENAGVLNFSEEYGIDALVIDRENFYKKTFILDFLLEKEIKLIALAGFLWLIPDYLINAYKDKILNIHPSLLPNYGGKGMYGSNVHEAVFEAKESESGITIHLVNEVYDKGEILLQKKVDVSTEKSPKEIAKKVLVLEHLHYPQVIEKYIKEKLV
jgi:phosphoribosylglycinamide formyltransferase-1